MLDFLYTLVTALAAAAFAQFGVTLDSHPGNEAATAQPEVHRTVPTSDQTGDQTDAPVHARNAATPAVRLPPPTAPSVGRKGGG
ncbi:MAG TPA: hypothetical protein VG407_04720 [Caulobacteraceae bacterium]|jgi:hypothetical protein|nr:hypothetical protein [Caulobacteraceae bacterium]